MASKLTIRIWLTTWLILAAAFVIIVAFSGGEVGFAFLAAGVALPGSIPGGLLLWRAVSFVHQMNCSYSEKMTALLISVLFICLPYGLLGGGLDGFFSHFNFSFFLAVTGVLFAVNLIAVAIHNKALFKLFGKPNAEVEIGENEVNYTAITTSEIIEENLFPHTQTNTIMEQNQLPEEQAATHFQPAGNSNKVLIKAAITGALILIMLIPTLFITNLVQEREQRQKEVVTEVCNKWAKEQTITAPYIAVPYQEQFVDAEKKISYVEKFVVLLPEEISVKGSMMPEERKRSIYTVLLYRSSLEAKGFFKVKVPQGINVTKLKLNEARLCIGLDDFKGIEEKVRVNFNGNTYDLTPGLPTKLIDNVGLSTAIPLTAENLESELPFSMALKIKGSEKLGFVPFSGNSSFTLQSSWPSPSFDGTSLPAERIVTDSGFTAQWNFNNANLPFNTFLKDFNLDKNEFRFGVSMVQPADQYAKTMRSVKYAILFIGLTFSLFFIVELMQKRPVHPVQYILVGLALVIFYTLLLSISEFILFDKAYLVASISTILLITMYAKGHFQKWSTAGVFAGVLSMLYSFIFILIRLEDTALLVGSIGLFIILAIVMYSSRKINWYNPSFGNKEPKIA